MIVFVDTPDIPNEAFDIFRSEVGDPQDADLVRLGSNLQSWAADKEKELDISYVVTFGINEPSYWKLLTSYLDHLSNLQNPQFLLVGSQSHHSADEFFQFISKINPFASGLVIDKQKYGLEKSSADRLIQADAFKMPFANESIDVVMTNRLLNNLRPYSERAYEVFLWEVSRVLKPGGLLALVENIPFETVPEDSHIYRPGRDFPMDWNPEKGLDRELDLEFRKKLEEIGFVDYQSFRSLYLRTRREIGKLNNFNSFDVDALIKEGYLYSYAIVAKKK